MPARIVTIAAAINRSIAVSGLLAALYESVIAEPGWEITILSCRWERPEPPARLVSGVAGLLLDRDFLSADLLIYHFDGWDPLFDAVVIGNGHARQAVFVYPLQPVARAAPSERQRAARSFAQLKTLRRADRLWPTCPESAALLAASDFDQARIEPFPLAGPAGHAAAPIERPRPERVGALIRDRIAALLPASRPQPGG
jgi:hypothetical protein